MKFHLRIFSGLVSFFLILFLSNAAYAQSSFIHRIVHKTPDPVIDPDPLGVGSTGPIIDLGQGPSINDAGKVAFWADDGTVQGKHIFLKNNNQIQLNAILGPGQTYAEGVEVNNADQMTFHFTQGPTAHGVVRVDQNLYQYPPTQGGHPLVANSILPNAVFTYITQPISINDTGFVTFGADVQVNPFLQQTVLASRNGGSGTYNMSALAPNFPTYYPTMSNNNRTIVRYGATDTNPVSPMWIFTDLTLGTALQIASGTTFSAISDKPGLSDNGIFAAFLGVHNSTGVGIYGQFGSFVPFKIAGNQAGTGLNSFSPFNRISVNSLPFAGPSVYRVAYIARNTSNVTGLYVTDVDISNPGNPGQPVKVVEYGDEIPGLSGTVIDIDMYDAANNNGELVYWVRMSNNVQAVIKSKERLCGVVQWPNEKPIQGAVIEGYYFAGTAPTNVQIQPVTSTPSVTSGMNGDFCVPASFFDPANTQMNELPGANRGVRARITYTEDTGAGVNNTTHTIVNYPEWDPFKSLENPVTGPLVIQFPYPVFFQPGVSGRVNDRSADRKLSAFLTLDAGANGQQLMAISSAEGIPVVDLQQWRDIKKGNSNNEPIPAFLYWAMPSKSSCGAIPFPSDSVTWGFDNCAFQSDDQIKGSSDALAQHFDLRIKPVIMGLSPNDYQDVLFNITGHSLGGVITRDWIVRDFPWPKHNRYLTYDSPHGGASYANSILAFLDDFWNERHMNGRSDTNGTPPPPGSTTDWGWNKRRELKFNSLGKDADRLFFTSLANSNILSLVTSPDESGYGVGRIMKKINPIFFWNFFSASPNGYCERFLHGWNMGVTGEGHSIQNAPHVFISAARFLAGKDQPSLGTASNPGVPFLNATLETGTGNQCPSVTPGNEPIKAKKRFRFSAVAGLNSARFLKFNANESLVVRAMVSHADATVTIIDNANIPYPKMNEIIESIDGETYITTFEVMLGNNGGQIRLTAGAVDASVFAEVISLNNNYQASVGSVNSNYMPGSNVTVRLQILDNTPAVTTGLTGTGQVTVTEPTGFQLVQMAFDDGMHDDVLVGDGIYGAIFNNVTEVGNYLISGDLDLTLSGGVEISRTASGQFTIDSTAVTANSVSAENVIDTNGNSLNDFIELDLNFNVLQNGRYRILPELKMGGTVIDNLIINFEETNAPVNNRIVKVRIPSYLLHEAGSAAPVTVDNLVVHDADRSIFLASLPVYTTQSYNLASFDVPEPPELYNSIPGSAPHSGGAAVQLYGKNLRNVTQVFFGTQSTANFTVVNNNILSVVVPPWDGVHEEVEVRVVTPWNQGGTTYIFSYFTPNQPPVLAPIGNQTAVATVPFQLMVSATDPENDPIALSAELPNHVPLSSIGATFMDNGNGTGVFSWTPTNAQLGPQDVIIYAVDTANLGFSSQTVTITVDPVINPSINIGSNLTTISQSQSLTLYFDILAGNTSRSVDVYLAVDLDPSPALNLFFLDSAFVFQVTPAPFQAGINITANMNIHTPVFTNVPLTGIAPQQYDFYAAILEAGTFNLIGGIDVHPITVIP